MLSSQITKDPECPICFYLNWCSITKDACLKNFKKSMNLFQVQILKRFCKSFPTMSTKSSKVICLFSGSVEKTMQILSPNGFA